mmetsp:Transcript_14148/g.42705  ORF Transcript_14148/g.42705 Transcript_14148/m.42705 type:complete len:206 (+) Transcript_14148:1263-1880(+)
MVFEAAGLLVLLAIGLCLPGAVGGQPHVLEAALVDRIVPVRQPRHRAVMPHLLPLMALVRSAWLWHGDTLSDVDGNVLGVDAALELAHLGMLPTAPEQARRLHPEVPHPLLHTVHQSHGVFLLSFLALLRNLLLLFVGSLLLFLLLLLKVPLHAPEVALVQGFDPVAAAQNALEALPEVFVEHRLLGIVRVQHDSIHGRHLLLLG